MIHDNPSKTVYALLQYQLAPSKNAACFPAQKQHIMRRALCLGALATASGSSVYTVDQHLQVARGKSPELMNYGSK